MTKVYLVGEAGCEHEMLIGIYANKEKALVAFQEHRLELLKDAKRGFEYSKESAKQMLKENKNYEGKPWDENMIKYLKNEAENGDDMYLDMIKKLSEEDPEKIDNYPHDTPYLRTEEVIE
jgi:hypothetical protein